MLLDAWLAGGVAGIVLVVYLAQERAVRALSSSTEWFLAVSLTVFSIAILQLLVSEATSTE